MRSEWRGLIFKGNSGWPRNTEEMIPSPDTLRAGDHISFDVYSSGWAGSESTRTWGTVKNAHLALQRRRQPVRQPAPHRDRWLRRQHPCRPGRHQRDDGNGVTRVVHDPLAEERQRLVERFSEYGVEAVPQKQPVRPRTKSGAGSSPNCSPSSPV